MKRFYTELVSKHLNKYEQMVFLSGPRQVGKTTIAESIIKQNSGKAKYLNWDNIVHRKYIMSLLEDTQKHSRLNRYLEDNNILVLDEIHKFSDWKNYLKGFYDTYKSEYRIILTGSSRLNVYRRGGDSLMGRYFNYTVHPISLGEVVRPYLPKGKDLIQKPKESKGKDYKSLLMYGGYPQPFLKRDDEFSIMWQKTRFQQLFREDIVDIENIKSIGQLELLAYLIQEQSGGLVNYTNLASKIQVSNNSIKKWIQLLESFYFCFTIRPWSQNISRSLIKEPKIYLWDWSLIKDHGMRFENFIVSHLYKSVSFWNENGKGDFGIYYLRTKEKKEVDFLVTKDKKPWILVEAKNSDNNSISKNLIYFKEKTKAEYAFQVVNEMDYVDKSCFDVKDPVIVPARTFLSQLV